MTKTRKSVSNVHNFVWFEVRADNVDALTMVLKLKASGPMPTLMAWEIMGASIGCYGGPL